MVGDNDSEFEYSWRADGPAIDNIEPSDVSLPVDVAQGAGSDGVDDEGTAQGAENDDDPSLPEHEDQGAAILPTTTFADPSSLRANDFTYSSNYSSSPLSDKICHSWREECSKDGQHCRRNLPIVELDNI